MFIVMVYFILPGFIPLIRAAIELWRRSQIRPFAGRGESVSYRFALITSKMLKFCINKNPVYLYCKNIMAKYGAELTEKIVNLIEEEFFTVSQVCKAVSISRETFYSWMNTRDDFRSEVEQAVTRREAELMMMVHASLKKKLEGYYTTVEKDIYVPGEHTGELVFKQKTITKKECPPDLRTIKMLLERQDRKNVLSRSSQEEEKAAKECTMKDESGTLEKTEGTDNGMQQKTIEEILETCAEAITEYPPKNEHMEREMKVLTSSQKRKAEQKKKKNTPLARTSSPCLVDRAKMFATQHTDGTSAPAGASQLLTDDC